MFRFTTRATLKGLIVILPIVTVVALVLWLIHSLESLLGRLAVAILGPSVYFPGMGILLALVLSCFVGLLMNTRPIQRVFDRWESVLRRIPLVKTLYGAMQDLASLLSSEKRSKFNRVVLVTLGETDVKLVGFVTREDLTGLALGGPDTIAVYLPMSYQIGGYLAVVPRSSVTQVDMSVEDASRLVFTAAVSVGGKNGGPR